MLPWKPSLTRKRDTASQTSTFIVEVRPMDVLMGRGTPSVRHEGNRYFRSVINEHKTEYAISTSNEEKDGVARRIVDRVAQMHGRFLVKMEFQEANPLLAEPLFKPMENQSRWLLADEEVVLTKVKQAARDLIKKDIGKIGSPLRTLRRQNFEKSKEADSSQPAVQDEPDSRHPTQGFARLHNEASSDGISKMLAFFHVKGQEYNASSQSRLQERFLTQPASFSPIYLQTQQAGAFSQLTRLGQSEINLEGSAGERIRLAQHLVDKLSTSSFLHQASMPSFTGRSSQSSVSPLIETDAMSFLTERQQMDYFDALRRSNISFILQQRQASILSTAGLDPSIDPSFLCLRETAEIEALQNLNESQRLSKLLRQHQITSQAMSWSSRDFNASSDLIEPVYHSRQHTTGSAESAQNGRKRKKGDEDEDTKPPAR